MGLSAIIPNKLYEPSNCTEYTIAFLLKPLILASGKQVTVTEAKKDPTLQQKQISTICRIACYLFAFTLWLPFTLIGLTILRVQYVNKNIETLDNAIDNDDVESIQALIRKGANVNAFLKNGETPLTYACRRNKPACVHALIQAGAHIDLKEKDGQSPLIVVASSDCNDANNVKIFQMLLNAGADIHQMDADSETPADVFYYAILHGKSRLVSALIQKGIDPNKDIKSNGLPPLAFAILLKKPNVILALAQGGAHVQHRFKTAEQLTTPLAFAASLNHTISSFKEIEESIRTLVACGALTHLPQPRCELEAAASNERFREQLFTLFLELKVPPLMPTAITNPWNGISEDVQHHLLTYHARYNQMHPVRLSAIPVK